MPITRRTLIAAAAGVGFMQSAPRLGRAQAANTIRIGVLNDQSGLYSHIGGVNGVAMAHQAVQEFGSRGFNVEVINADHQNRPDVGVNIAGNGTTRAWT
jgi:branched-chain amino acid transport system substrate-binding protein